VLGEADAVEATRTGEIRQFFRLEIAALGERERVAMEVDQHPHKPSVSTRFMRWQHRRNVFVMPAPTAVAGLREAQA
jgi:hypothetical protein